MENTSIDDTMKQLWVGKREGLCLREVPTTPETGCRLQSVFTFQARSPQFSTDSLREL